MRTIKMKSLFFSYLILAVGWTQDFETAWGNYLTVDAHLKVATKQEQKWDAQQNILRDKIHALQENQSWYNGWINKMQLARLSAKQVELADSLQQIQQHLNNLNDQRVQAFKAFKTIYQQILLSSGEENELSRLEKERAIIIGHQLVKQGNNIKDLPDYTSLLNNPYENDALRQLVLVDLQSILKGKVTLIDSLLTEKKVEVALLSRLNEFHRDLDYQQRSNIDVRQGSQPEATFSVTDVGAQDDLLLNYGGEFDEKNYLGERTIYKSSASQTQIVSDETNLPLDIEPVDLEINQLKAKHIQYQELLNQIAAELAQ